MKKRYTFITLLTLGGLFLLLALLAGPMYAQSSGPSSAPMEGQAAAAEDPPDDPITEKAPDSAVPPTSAQSSAPLSPAGSSTGPTGDPFLEDEPPQVSSAPAAILDFRIPGTALKPRGDDVSYLPTAGGGCFYASAGNSFRVFNSGVYLPQGSHILVMRMYYDDTSSSNSRAWFSVYDLYGEIVEEWAVDSVGDTGNSFNDTDLISHTIDYLSYSYAVNWRPLDLGSDMQLCGFRFFYEPAPFGAAFLPMMISR